MLLIMLKRQMKLHNIYLAPNLSCFYAYLDMVHMYRTFILQVPRLQVLQTDLYAVLPSHTKTMQCQCIIMVCFECKMNFEFKSIRRPHFPSTIFNLFLRIYTSIIELSSTIYRLFFFCSFLSYTKSSFFF